MASILNEYKSLFATIKSDKNFSWHKDSLYRMVDLFVLRHSSLGRESGIIQEMKIDLYKAISEIQ
jgi:hypothetical protein